jgi:hypothetical protein
MDMMDARFEDEQDTLKETLEKKGTPKDAIKVILDRRLEMYEAANRPPRVMEAVILKDPAVTKWETESEFVGFRGYPVNCDGRLIGIMHTPELAEAVVAAHNGTFQKKFLV